MKTSHLAGMMGGGLLASQLLRLIGWPWLGLVLGCLLGLWLAVRADRPRLSLQDREKLRAAAERRATRNAKRAGSCHAKKGEGSC